MFSRSCKDVIDGIDLLLSDLTSSLIKINSCSLEHSVGKSSANTFDASESEHSFDVTLYVGVLDSKNVSILIIVNDLQ